MPLPVISATVAAIILIVQLILMVTVGAHRGKHGVNLGIGEDRDLERKVRRHGNLSENAALFVVTLALAELVGAPSALLWAFAGVFLAARFFHILAFGSLTGSHGDKGSTFFIAARIAGAMGTGFSGIGLGGYLLFMLGTA
ncbi:MAPEG family protein [Parasphingopyxis algicola]|uniref:MAPEG family protein n=1 Tax=Parasphingopyxis algicola TaxID=2026624 RepID=UPI00159FB9D5|nr:MAPEG family protein [Parasphingopyxis algicola]QLC25102.1 MAPEG family protein [Parasphingopyxis algicola]